MYDCMTAIVESLIFTYMSREPKFFPGTQVQCSCHDTGYIPGLVVEMKPCLGLPLPHLCIGMCDLQPGGISSASDGLCRDCPVITDVIHVQFVYLYRFIIHVV